MYQSHFVGKWEELVFDVFSDIASVVDATCCKSGEVQQTLTDSCHDVHMHS